MKDKVLCGGVGTVTLVGFHYRNPPPYRSGNCFSLYGKGGNYRIVNFNHENLEYLLENGFLEFPIEVTPLGGGVGIITDERIPEEWFSSEYCEVCCPRDLWPQPQKDRFNEKVESGEIEVMKMRFQDGKEYEVIKRYVGSSRVSPVEKDSK